MSSTDGRNEDETLVSVPLDRDEAEALLASWRCCGSPNLCGARCMDDEESHRMAQFAAFIDNEQVNNSGLARELGDTRARLAAVETEATRLRDHAEAFLYDGDHDVALPGYVEVYGVADALAALGATDE